MKCVPAMRTVLAITLLGFTAVGRPSAAEALATNVSCGAVITTDTTLHRNLANCPNNGIVIGADNITLNLNGHTIDGDGALIAECPDGEACDVGVDNGAGHSGVTIADGAITDFEFGIGVLGASDNRVRRPRRVPEPPRRHPGLRLDAHAGGRELRREQRSDHGPGRPGRERIG